jgi:hypothetical protein
MLDELRSAPIECVLFEYESTSQDGQLIHSCAHPLTFAATAAAARAVHRRRVAESPRAEHAVAARSYTHAHTHIVRSASPGCLPSSCPAHMGGGLGCGGGGGLRVRARECGWALPPRCRRLAAAPLQSLRALCECRQAGCLAARAVGRDELDVRMKRHSDLRAHVEVADRAAVRVGAHLWDPVLVPATQHIAAACEATPVRSAT